MNNILIPTSFEIDTLLALKVAAGLNDPRIKEVTLLRATPVSDSIMELLFPTTPEDKIKLKREQVFKMWAKHVEQNQLSFTHVKEHHQLALSKPILMQLLDRFSVELVIVPWSYQQSKDYTDRFMLRLLHECKTPLMLLPEEHETQVGIQRALFLDENVQAPLATIEHLPFHVIYQSMVRTSNMNSLKAMVDNLRINMLVLARGTEKKLLPLVANIGLPVLTV